MAAPALLPTDADGDGLYEDINGNGRRDLAEVVLHLNQMTRNAANEPLEAFDYNGNGRIDFADVVWLFINFELSFVPVLPARRARGDGPVRREVLPAGGPARRVGDGGGIGSPFRARPW